MSITIKLPDLKAIIKRQALLEPDRRRTILLFGAPGSGKSEYLSSFSGCTGVFMGSTADEDKAKGIFARNNEGQLELAMTPAMQDFFDRAEAYDKYAIMFIDELGEMSREVSLAMNHLILNRIYCDRKLPDNVIVVAASNLRKHQAGAGTFMAHQINRVKVYELKVDSESWMDWANTRVPTRVLAKDDFGNVLSPKQWVEEPRPRVHPDVVAFISMKPAALYCVQDDATDEAMAEMYRQSSREGTQFVSPRSMVGLSDELMIAEEIGDQVLLADVASHLGPGRAAEFMALRNCKIPSHADLLMGRAEMPKDPMPLWMCVIRLGQLLTPGNSKDTCSLVKNLNPEMVEVFLKVAGRTAMGFLKENNMSVGSPRMALIQRNQVGASLFPGFAEELLAPDSRYFNSLQA